MPQENQNSEIQDFYQNVLLIYRQIRLEFEDFEKAQIQMLNVDRFEFAVQNQEQSFVVKPFEFCLEFKGERLQIRW